MSQKPSLPKGTRDFGPQQMAKRNHILNTIKDVFETYGFVPVETPAMENLSVLTGKYGDEGDQLLFKVLDSGDYMKTLQNEIKELSEVKDLFQVVLKKLLRACLLNLDEQDLTHYPSIKDIFEKHSDSLINLHSWKVPSQKYLIKKYFEESKASLALIACNFFSTVGSPNLFIFEDGDITNRINDKKFDSHFRQFVSNEINAKILQSFLVFSSINNPQKITPYITGKGLKYDLTVPFARYVVMNRNDITLPFKRYQIQPVWRADRPQKGRYREFYQCDADVIGTDSLICEAEIIMMMTSVLSQLKIEDYTIKVNNRKILTGITEAIGAHGKESDFCVAIDKLDKIGMDSVLTELKDRGLSSASIEQVGPILNLKGGIKEKLSELKKILNNSSIGMEGLNEVEEMLELTENMDGKLDNVDFDLTLARGLSYYTGAIFEIQVNNVKIGSISGGGRYDNLTGVFGMPNMSGVGFSFGVDRIYDVLEELNLFPTDSLTSTQALIIHFDKASMDYGLGVVANLRKAGIKSELYPDQAKVKKQFTYADKKNILYTIIIGSDEIASNKLTLRNMQTGEEDKLVVEKIVEKLS